MPVVEGRGCCITLAGVGDNNKNKRIKTLSSGSPYAHTLHSTAAAPFNGSTVREAEQQQGLPHYKISYTPR